MSKDSKNLFSAEKRGGKNEINKQSFYLWNKY